MDKLQDIVQPCARGDNIVFDRRRHGQFLCRFYALDRGVAFSTDKCIHMDITCEKEV